MQACEGEESNAIFFLAPHCFLRFVAQTALVVLERNWNDGEVHTQHNQLPTVQHRAEIATAVRVTGRVSCHIPFHPPAVPSLATQATNQPSIYAPQAVACKASRNTSPCYNAHT